MYLLYLDHSGEVFTATEKYLVMAGAAIFERQIYYLKQAVHQVQLDYLREEAQPFEFHASFMRAGHKAPWNAMERKSRLQVMEAVYNAIANAHRPGLVLFGVVVEKAQVVRDFPLKMAAALQKKKETEERLKGVAKEDVQQQKEARRAIAKAKEECRELAAPILSRGFEGVCTQFEFFLRRFYVAEDPERQQRGLMLLDHASYEQDVELLMHEFARYGTSFTPLYNIVEVPLFADSRSTRMLQIADFVSNALFRRYEAGDTVFFDLIAHRFDQLDGTLHGLSHVTSDTHCMCPACLSRRIRRGTP